MVTGLPTAYRKLLEMPNFNDYDTSSVRMYTTGGDALTGKTLSQWQAKTGKPIWEGLGGTEMMHLVTSNTDRRRPHGRQHRQGHPRLRDQGGPGRRHHRRPRGSGQHDDQGPHRHPVLEALISRTTSS